MGLDGLNEYWKACCYLSAGMIYLQDNPLLKEPLRPEHIKNRLLGHWGASPGLSFVYVHANRVIIKYDLDCIFIAGPGHGAPGVIAPAYLEGTLSELYPEFTLNEDGMRRLFRAFSFPGGFGSHCTPELPGSIQEGGELGYSLAHAYGAVFDNPDLIAVTVVGDGEAETGPLATAWHSNKFLNLARDGAVLPVLLLNGYKINNPTVLARIEDEELSSLFRGYGYEPRIVSDADQMGAHESMAEAMDWAAERILALREEARAKRQAQRARLPLIILREPKGWTAPKKIKDSHLEGYWRAHQVPLPEVKTDPESLRVLEDWLRSYQPERLFTKEGALREDLRCLAPEGEKRMSANPQANAGGRRHALMLPNPEKFSVKVELKGATVAGNTKPLGHFLKEVMRLNPTSFRLFGPDETKSNRLDAVFEFGKAWMAKTLPEDADEGFLSPTGRTMEYLSEHTVEGWLEGYLLTGRYGLLSTYEGFAPIISSMVNQFGKWLDISSDVHWRLPIPSLNLLLTSVVWRQDHNGFTHQDPGFINAIVDKWPSVVRLYFPPDANSLLWTVWRAFQTSDRINIIVIDKQRHPQYLDADEAFNHVTKGLGIWDFASVHPQEEPDVVIASCGDVPTKEAKCAVEILREYFPDLRIRFVNVVNLFTLVPSGEHPDGLTDREFDSYFTKDRPIIFNFHGYPWLIHRLAYRRTNHKNLHVRGYRENRKIGMEAAYLVPFLKGRGGITTPMQLAIINQIDRFSVAMDVIDRVEKLATKASFYKDRIKDQQIEALAYAYEHGVDHPNYAE
ncbi:phosphoketolase family protein [Pyrinomonas methylaliphatogenes]|uniref:Phosphoketolase n=1 Tax=Pyrinomonas methylaliphatogenes TaxID=454194 RepID=A0A0B6WZ42_9BACT|nr:phosphoketolase family protein [Pyrinomonas methylaliphatogenes]CDM65992.1 phosphoketolase [Pyrinomonas methylaliphatogenes]